MAGSYPDVPSRRMAWDDDGTIGFYQNQSVKPAPTVLNTTQKVELNDEDNASVAFGGGSGNGQTWWFWHFFPEQREFDGIFAAVAGTGHNGAVHTSVDTTNGIDGTWVQQVADLPNYNEIYPSNYRTGITSVAVSNVRSIRTVTTAQSNQGNPNVMCYHVYGEITPGQTPDRLLYVDSGTGLEFGLPIDYGDIPRGSAADRQFKLRNNSGTLTATTVQMTAESLYLNSGAWFTFSDGGAFQSTLPLTAGSIGPGADSATVTLRRIVPDSESTGLHVARVQVSVGTWS